MYRFEILLIALLLVLFDKIFVVDSAFFTKYVWSANMMILGIASVSIFKERAFWLKWLRNILFLITVLVPLCFNFIADIAGLIELSLFVYLAYYSLIFTEVLRQIIKKSETNVSVILGSVCGFLLLIIIALFAFLLLEYNIPHSFNGISGSTLPELYSQLSYFSMVTLTTVGFGDITPASDSARLSTMFFTVAGQFYMVALVGIIISRFTSTKNE
ncbi:ion channel [Hugenholtzia roseola]|uniref:ion channel n=1 Tax=Hugenholtzia roseola TaxID=1002 RepID=UPI000424EFC6|nr:ion channel [Hugenholtzia roseola]